MATVTSELYKRPTKSGVTVKGFDEIRLKLFQFDQKMRRKVVRKALKQGAELIKNTAIVESRIKHDKASSGNLRKHIATKAMTNKETGSRHIMGQKVYIKSGKDLPPSAFYWKFLEFGYHPWGHEKFVKKPFMRPAYEKMKRPAYNLIIDTMRRELFK